MLSCWCKPSNTVVVRIEVACLSLLVGFSLATLCHRRLQTQYLPLPPAERAPSREASHASVAGMEPSQHADGPPSPPARPRRQGRSASALLPGYTFAGVGNLPGDDAACEGDGPRRLPGALGSMCQPGNVSVHQCSWACDQLSACLGFVWSPKPPWSKYSECYLKGSCPLGRLRALDGSFTWQKNSQLCASKRRHEWVELYGQE